MAEPTFRIEYQRNGDTLRARFSGDNSALDTLVACWMALAEELRRDPPAALLVVDEMQGAAPDPDELAQFVQSMVGLGFEGVRVAYVEAYALQVPEAEVGEILAREQGFQVRVFGNEAAAAVWLRHGMA
ncbi:hypothetical protein [Thermomonas aquatica]|jgi:hypothetical protein|uniref:STAS/SEC14 domain-containing protein n=1 Tax=Thermomonas aquatica TaxID=2202149 RepID=A0A5B7ZT75_9GAMM|nr:hypothetical protein [Thermomonas aquatica]QDA58371.1 hypothetical protein FHQ07_14170 [Thermomonas aquatica]